MREPSRYWWIWRGRVGRGVWPINARTPRTAIGPFATKSEAQSYFDAHRKRTRKNAQYIDITPTWSAMMPVFIEVLRNPKADWSAKKDIIAELMRLAKFADDVNAKSPKMLFNRRRR